MKSIYFLLYFIITAYGTYAIEISGIVKNSEGIGIKGVAVKLGKAAIVSTTGSDGSFTLKDNATGKRHHINTTPSGNTYLVKIDNNRLSFRVMERTEVSIKAYDYRGRYILSFDMTVSSGDHSIPFPHFAQGMVIYRISINNEYYTFRSISGISQGRELLLTSNRSDRFMQTKATAQLDDALIFVKDGYQLHRIPVTNPDTSGMQITLVPLDTGTVTDVEGNEYKTVRIGNQVWTAENLRATKFNDGSSIGSGCHFYNNATDAASQKKWGAFYNWATVKTGKLAPKGWHVPTNSDWDTLQNYLISHGYNFDGTTSDNKIAKSLAAATIDWDTCSEMGAISNDLNFNNASGFSAIPAGWRYWMNDFRDQKQRAYWWTSTIAQTTDAVYTHVCDLWYRNYELDRTYYTLVECSVRLVQNE